MIANTDNCRPWEKCIQGKGIENTIISVCHEREVSAPITNMKIF